MYRTIIIFPYVPGHFSLISNVIDFFIHSLNRFVLKNKQVPYVQLSHDPRSEHSQQKMSAANTNGAGGSGSSLRPHQGP